MPHRNQACIAAKRLTLDQLVEVDGCGPECAGLRLAGRRIGWSPALASDGSSRCMHELSSLLEAVVHQTSQSLSYEV